MPVLDPVAVRRHIPKHLSESKPERGVGCQALGIWQDSGPAGLVGYGLLMKTHGVSRCLREDVMRACVAGQTASQTVLALGFSRTKVNRDDGLCASRSPASWPRPLWSRAPSRGRKLFRRAPPARGLCKLRPGRGQPLPPPAADQGLEDGQDLQRDGRSDQGHRGRPELHQTTPDPVQRGYEDLRAAPHGRRVASGQGRKTLIYDPGLQARSLGRQSPRGFGGPLPPTIEEEAKADDETKGLAKPQLLYRCLPNGRFHDHLCQVAFCHLCPAG